MTNISKAHQTFSNRLTEPRFLEYPDEFLGPNYEAVLDFWLFLEDLTKTQWETINGRYWDFYDNHESEWEKAADEAIEASEETIGLELANKAAMASFAVPNVGAAVWATRELIGMHLILEQQKPLSFFNMFLDL